MPSLQELDTRLTNLEIKVHNQHTWVVYWDNNKNRYFASTITWCKRNNIAYLPTEYPCAQDARDAIENGNI